MSSSGIFYPKHFLLEDADRGVRQLKNAGWADDDVIAIPGEEVVRFKEDHLLATGLWGLLMSQLSR